MPMQKPSRLLPDDSHHLMATDCVLPQVALWGKGMVCALKRTSGLNGWISNQKHISLQSVALREGSCGFEVYLIDKREKGEATAQDEERIVELDTFLEKTYGNEDSVPAGLKQMSNLEKLNTLIEKVDYLINKMN